MAKKTEKSVMGILPIKMRKVTCFPVGTCRRNFPGVSRR